MPAAIIAGLPIDSDRQVQSALVKQPSALPVNWDIIWMRSKGRLPGLAPSQLEAARHVAAARAGAHFLIFRGREKHDEELAVVELATYFRIRWLDQAVLRMVPRSMDQFFETITEILGQELQWIDLVKPRSESSCLLLPEGSFWAAPQVRHLWTAAREAGIERIALAARAIERFATVHWLPSRSGSRVWTDAEDRVFDHRGARHGTAPFPRSWKYSYKTEAGFHFDVTSRNSRAFRIVASDGTPHQREGTEHVNIDPHGYVRF